MDKHSKEWEIMRYQGKKHRREKAVLIAIIVVLLIINAILSNIVWSSRHNNETASAADVAIMQAERNAMRPPTTEKPHKKQRVIRDTGG